MANARHDQARPLGSRAQRGHTGPSVADSSRKFPWARIIAAAAIAVVASLFAGFAIGFGHASKTLDASDRARFLANAIAEALNCAALFAIIAVPCAVLFVAIRARRARQA